MLALPHVFIHALSPSSHHQIFCLEKKARLSAKETHLMQHAAKREKEVQKGLSLKSQHAGKRGAGKKEKKVRKVPKKKQKTSLVKILRPSLIVHAQKP